MSLRHLHFISRAEIDPLSPAPSVPSKPWWMLAEGFEDDESDPEEDGTEKEKEEQDTSGERVRVVLRLRPMSGEELDAGDKCVIQFSAENPKELLILDPNTMAVQQGNRDPFIFDELFGEVTSNFTINDRVAT